MAKVCDYCNLRIRQGTVIVGYQGNEFHETCWNWMERQKRIAQRKQAVGSTFSLIRGDSATDERDQT